MQKLFLKQSLLIAWTPICEPVWTVKENLFCSASSFSADILCTPPRVSVLGGRVSVLVVHTVVRSNTKGFLALAANGKLLKTNSSSPTVVH